MTCLCFTVHMQGAPGLPAPLVIAGSCRSGAFISLRLHTSPYKLSPAIIPPKTCRVLLACLLLWSLATAASGLVTSLPQVGGWWKGVCVRV